LTFEGLVALTLIVTAIVAMWLIVIHILGIPGSRRAGRVLLAGGASSWQEISTIPATRSTGSDGRSPKAGNG
jgi:hypothetical protein